MDIKNLFSSKHSEDDCNNLDMDTIIYNLYEDIRCLKEELKSKEAELLAVHTSLATAREETKNIEKYYTLRRIK